MTLSQLQITFKVNTLELIVNCLSGFLEGRSSFEIIYI